MRAGGGERVVVCVLGGAGCEEEVGEWTDPGEVLYTHEKQDRFSESDSP